MDEQVYKYNILLVEDNPGDVRLTKEFLYDNPYLNNLEVVFDGEEAIRLLKKTNEYTNAELPNLIILDLNLPKKNGIEVLREIKTDETLKHIPVVVLTSSESDTDIIESYELYANCYISKPVNFENYSLLFNKMLYFWCGLARIPRNIDKKQ
jgi:two-component system, chemotaxis family, response regulator Rcp1